MLCRKCEIPGPFVEGGPSKAAIGHIESDLIDGMMMEREDTFYFYKGRVALFALLRAAGVGPQDRVLMPGYTCVVVPLAVAFLEAIPEYADVSPQTYNSQMEHYEAAWARLMARGYAGSVKAVLIQHTYGSPNTDTIAVVDWAREKGLWVIEDCAHCLHVTLNGREVGRFGDASFFSYQWSKPATSGLGGMALVNTSQLLPAVRLAENEAPTPGLRENLLLALQLIGRSLMVRPRTYWFALDTFRRLSDLGLFVGSSSSSELAGHMPADYLKKMGVVQRRALHLALRGSVKHQQYRVELADRYDHLLASRGIPTFSRVSSAIPLRYPVVVPDRDALLDAARGAHVELGDWFNCPLHPQGADLAGLNWDDRVCPEAVRLASTTVNLPVHKRISGQVAEETVNFVAEWSNARETRK